MKRMLLLCLAASILLPGLLAQAGVSNEEWGKIRQEFTKLWAEKKKTEAVELLGKTDDFRSVKMLFDILTKYHEEDDINQAAMAALGKTADEKAIDWLAKNATRPMSPEKRGLVCDTLAGIKNPKIGAALLDLLEKGKDGPTRAAAIDALGRMGEKSAIPAIIKALSDRDWQVRYAAVEALVRFMDKRAIPALIERLKKEDGRLRGDSLRALRAMTGKDHDSAPAWESWWKLNEGKNLAGGGHQSFRNDQEEQKEKKRAGGGGEAGGGSVTSVPTYYGIKIYSKRIVFIIDISGSMDEKYDGKKPKRNPTVTITGAGKGDPVRKATLPWHRIKTKWDLAREQLIFTLQQLDPKTNINIIWYNKGVWAWKKTLVPATTPNSTEAIGMLRKLKPKDSTNIYGALQRGFALDGQSKPTAITNYQTGVDTIFFLTDGWPTSGKIAWKRMGGRKENENWIDEMLKAIGSWNKTRRIKVHTVGIGDHPKDFMQKLAEEFGGQYVVPGEDD